MHIGYRLRGFLYWYWFMTEMSFGVNQVDVGFASRYLFRTLRRIQSLTICVTMTCWLDWSTDSKGLTDPGHGKGEKK